MTPSPLNEDTVKTGTLPAATDVDGDAVTYARPAIRRMAR